MTTRTYFDNGTYSTFEMRRVQRRFRAHVAMPSNPLGRIVRRPCFFCMLNAVRGGWPKLEHLPPAPFHHLSYAPGQEFRGVWACDSHHRKMDHGKFAVPEKAIFDYTSLIDGVAKYGLRRESRLVCVV